MSQRAKLRKAQRQHLNRQTRARLYAANDDVTQFWTADLDEELTPATPATPEPFPVIRKARGGCVQLALSEFAPEE